METALGFAVFVVFMLLAALGLVIPVLPSALLALAGVVLFGLITAFERVTWEVIGWSALLVGASVLADNLLAAVGASLGKASRAGVIGALIGTIGGGIVFPPFGLLIGAFAGAVAGEALTGRIGRQALRSGWWSLMGALAGLLVRMLTLGVIVWLTVRAAFG